MVNLFISGVRDQIKEKSFNPTTLPTSTLDYLTSTLNLLTSTASEPVQVISINASTENEETTATPDNSAEVNVVLVNPETDINCFLTCSGLCIDQDQICDGLLDCKQGEDEINCQLRQCENDEFKCVEGKYQVRL